MEQMESLQVVRKQWNEAARSWVEFIRSGKNYYSEFLNGPALRRAMGKVEEKQVLDIGCGEGYFSRLFARLGAKVTAVDISENLIRAAIEEEERHPLGIRYIASDAADLRMLESHSFDAAFCYMALHDIEDYEGAISEASRILKAGAKFVIVMEHPCFNTRFMNGKMVAGWETQVGTDGSKEHMYYRVENYLRRHSYTFEWKHDRLPSSFVTTGFHRTLSDYFNALTSRGFIVTSLEEPQPTEEGARVHRPMKKHYRVPHSIVFEAKRLKKIDL